MKTVVQSVFTTYHFLHKLSMGTKSQSVNLHQAGKGKKALKAGKAGEARKAGKAGKARKAGKANGLMGETLQVIGSKLQKIKCC